MTTRELEGNYETPNNKLWVVKVTTRITGRCNRGCSDCYDNENIGNAKLDRNCEDALINQVGELASQGIKVFSHITGGEPLLHQRCAEIVKRELGAGALVSLITSGCTGDETGVDIDNLDRLAEIRSDNLTPLISSKFTLPKFMERFRYTLDKLSRINGMVSIRHVVYPDQESLWRDFLAAEGWAPTSVEDIKTTDTRPKGLFRRDIIFPGRCEQEYYRNEPEYYCNKDGIILQVYNHNVLKAGLASSTQDDTLRGDDCVFLRDRKRTLPYLDIWPDGGVYPCFIIGKPIPELRLGNIAKSSIPALIAKSALTLEARQSRFSNGAGGDECDRCRNIS